MAFYFEHIYVNICIYMTMLRLTIRLTITQSLCTIIIIIKQVPASSKIIVLFKTIIIKVHPTFLSNNHFIVNDDPGR